MSTSEKTTAIDVIANTVAHKQFQEVLRKSLPTGASQERFTQAVVAALRHKPEVFVECEKSSVYSAIVEAARAGLIPDGRQGALVPFNTKTGKRCQWMIMPEGIIDKLAKLGISAYAVSVHAGDKIRIWNDDKGQHVEHEPLTFGDRGARIGAFACARILATGITFVEAMNQDDLEAPRRVTKSKDKNGNLVGPWVEFPDRMEQKTCLHRLEKRLPNVAASEDEEFREGITVDVAPTPMPPVAARPAALQRMIDQAPEKPIPEEEPPPIETEE